MDGYLENSIKILYIFGKIEKFNIYKLYIISRRILNCIKYKKSYKF